MAVAAIDLREGRTGLPETRLYAMPAAASTLSALHFYGAHTKGGRRRWLLCNVVTAIAINTHYHALFVVVFENLFALLWRLHHRRNARDWLISKVVLVGKARVTLNWQAIDPAGKRHHALPHLISTSLCSQGETVLDSHTIVLPPATPPGNYRVAVELCDSSTGARLPISDPAGQSLDDRVILDTVAVQ